jgi:hypothetical protein
MLRLEGLEERTVMSTVTQPGPTLLLTPSPGIFRSAGPATLSPLTQLCGIDSKHDFGDGTGTYKLPVIVAFRIGFDGPIYQLTGSGNFLDLTNATISGDVFGVGSSSSRALGFLTFTNSQGSVTIGLTGPEQAGYSALPGTFSYSVEDGTGAYASLKGSGSLTLNLGPPSQVGRAFGGEFTLTIDSFNKLRHSNGNGSYTQGVELDAGVQYQLTGLGQFFGLKEVGIAGSLYSVGSIRGGHARGELTFTDAKGSVTIELVGPEQAAFSPLPVTFRYTVKKATGACAHMIGSGTLSLKLSPTTGEGVPSDGDFTLTLDTFTKS